MRTLTTLFFLLVGIIFLSGCTYHGEQSLFGNVGNGTAGDETGGGIQNETNASNEVTPQVVPPAIHFLNMGLEKTEAVADYLDLIPVTIEVTDEEGEGVAGAQLELLMLGGKDTKETFPVQDAGGGTYNAAVKSSVADNFTLVLRELGSNAVAYGEVSFKAGAPYYLKLAATNPRLDAYSESNISAYVTDKFGNLVDYSNTVVDFGSTRGLFSTITRSGGVFSATLRATDYGRAVVTATEANSGLSENINVDFPAVYLDTPKYAVLGEKFGASVIMYIHPDKEINSLGYYDLTINYDPTAISPSIPDIQDSNPYDYILMTNAAVVSPGVLHISGTATNPEATSNGRIMALTLGFTTINAGDSKLNVSVNESALRAICNTSILTSEHFRGTATLGLSAYSTHVVEKPRKDICIRLWNVAGSLNDAQFNQDTEAMQALFNNHVNISCPRVKFNFEVENISFETWNTTIDLNHDGNLSEFAVSTNPTNEEIELLKHRKSGCLNVYYVPKLSDGSLGEAFCPKFPQLNSTNRTGVVVGKGVDSMTLAHEIGHIFDLTHDEYENSTGAWKEKMNNGQSVEAPDTNVMHHDAHHGITQNKLMEGQCDALKTAINNLQGYL